ncbi:MAG TPA: YihY/virulence factor BrkB family protein [Tepidisphaeraceae bacterium]|jgi:membrane protein
MASLRDVVPVLRSFGTWAFLKRIWQQISEDGIFVWASALAYSWLFSVFPFLILLLSLVPYLPLSTKESAHRVIAGFITSMLGSAAYTLNDNIDSVMLQPRRGWLIVGLAVSVWVASGGMSMTISALDKCYDVKIGRSYVRQRALAIALTLGVAVCMLLIIILLPIGEGVEAWMRYQHLAAPPVIWAFNAARYGLSFVLAMFVLSIIYYFGPAIRQRFQLLSPGALFSAVVWIVLDLAFRFYIDRFARYDQTYGAVGGVAILLLFFYIDGLVLLIGAEINSEIDFERLGVPAGSHDFTGPAKITLPGLPEMSQEL